MRMLAMLRVMSPKSKIPRWKMYWQLSTRSKPRSERVRFPLLGSKRQPRGINMSRFIRGTKRLPLLISVMKDKGFKE